MAHNRVPALAYRSNAIPAGSNGAPPTAYVMGDAKGARLVAGVSELVGEWEPPQPTLCSAPTRSGAACKARPVAGSILCASHMRQAAKAAL